MDTPELPFEYCALCFLIQWEQQEHALHKQIADNPSLQQIRSALGYFQAARTFKGLGSDEVAQGVAEALRQVDASSGLSPEAKVTTLASRFMEGFDRFNLSAASKLFWLKHKRPYIIYDSRAVIALRNVGCKFENGNYSDYCRCWRNQYSRVEEAVKKAAARLGEVRAFLPWYQTEAQLTGLASQPWFLERVFDTYLWGKGGGG